MSELKTTTPKALVMTGRHNEPIYLKSEVDAAIAELKAEINRKEAVGKRWFERCMEARAENVRLKRALWLARAERAAAWQVHWALCHNNSIEREFSINGASMPCEGMVTMRTARDWSMIWKKVASKCRAKAEEYK